MLLTGEVARHCSATVKKLERILASSRQYQVESTMADITSGTLTTRPSTPLQHDPSKPRDLIVGPDSPEPPYPVYLEGWVTRGFGRGSKDLGTPTGELLFVGRYSLDLDLLTPPLGIHSQLTG